METIFLVPFLYIRSFAKLNIDKKEDLTLDTFKEVILKAGYQEMQENELEELYEEFTDTHEFFSLLRVSVLTVFFLSCL